jgi:hypothetical protein
MHEIPLLALAEREHVAEQLLGLGAVEEVLLVRRALIGVARRHRDADAEFGGEVEEFCDVFGGWPSKIVALTLTVKPRAFAALIAETARSNTPSCDTALS